MLNTEHREVLRARGYANHTLRQRKMLCSWLGNYERDRGELLDPATYDLATHDRGLHYLRSDRNLAQNTIASFVRGLKVFLRWCREDRGMSVPVELRKLQGKHADVLKMWLTAEDLAALTTALLPAHLTRVRDVLLGWGAGAAAGANQDAHRREQLPHRSGRDHHRQIRRGWGTGAAAASPEAFKAVYALQKYLGQSSLTLTHPHLILLRASLLNRCGFCINMHVNEARKHGETDQRLHLVAVWREAGELFTPEEKALLALTEEVTLISQHHASNTTYNAAAALFGEHYLAQAIMAIATVNVWSRIAITQLPVAA